jgi:hypothetical protein
MEMISPHTFNTLQTHLRKKNSLPSPNHASEDKFPLHSALEYLWSVRRPGTNSIPTFVKLPNRTGSARRRRQPLANRCHIASWKWH